MIQEFTIVIPNLCKFALLLLVLNSCTNEGDSALKERIDALEAQLAEKADRGQVAESITDQASTEMDAANSSSVDFPSRETSTGDVDREYAERIRDEAADARAEAVREQQANNAEGDAKSDFQENQILSTRIADLKLELPTKLAEVEVAKDKERAARIESHLSSSELSKIPWRLAQSELKGIQLELRRLELEISSNEKHIGFRKKVRDQQYRAEIRRTLARKGTEVQHKGARSQFEACIRQNLKDPEGARFLWCDEAERSNWDFFLNAKNAYGGYVGQVRVWVQLVPNPQNEGHIQVRKLAEVAWGRRENAEAMIQYPPRYEPGTD